MSDFQVLKVSDKALLAYEIFKYVSPYATTASFLISAYSFFTDEHQDNQNELVEKLDDLVDRVEATKEALLQKIEHTVLKDLTAKVNGIALGFADYGATNSIGTLDNLLTQSALTRSALEGYIEDTSQPIELRITLTGLYTLFSAVRIDVLGAYKTQEGTNDGALNIRINDQKFKALQYEVPFSSMISTLNNGRFSNVHTNDINSMEPNTPVYVIGYDFEGNFQTTGSVNGFGPNGDYSQKREQANEKRENRVQATFDEAWRPCKEYFHALKNSV